MSKKIIALGETLAARIEERGIIARCEMLQRTYQAVREANLAKEDREELALLTGKRRIAPGIFQSMMSGESVLPLIPKLDSAITIEGRIFHFPLSAGYDKPDFQRAYEAFRRSRKELLELVESNLEDLLMEFMADAGYDLLERTPSGLRFAGRAGMEVDVMAFPRIGMVRLDDCLREERVVLVPHEESPAPFIEFFRDWSDAAEEAGMQFWVANMEEGTIDPFIGNTIDPNIYKQFKNPGLSTRIRSTWKR